MRPSNRLMIPRLRSVDPSSTTMTSFAGHVWDSALSIVCSIQRSALQTGIRMETSGLKVPLTWQGLNRFERRARCRPVDEPFRVLKAFDQLGYVPPGLGREPAGTLLPDCIDHFCRPATEIDRLVGADEAGRSRTCARVPAPAVPLVLMPGNAQEDSQAIDATLEPSPPSARRYGSNVDGTNIVSHVRDRQNSIVSDDRQGLVFRRHEAASDSREHATRIFDAADHEIRRHRIDRNAFVANKT